MTEGLDRFFPESSLEEIMDPDIVCPEKLDPDPAISRPDPKPYLAVAISTLSISETCAPLSSYPSRGEFF